MALLDVVFGEGDIQNFLVETGDALLNPPQDILTESATNSGVPCLETSLEVIIPEIPNIIVLNDGQLAKRVTDKFYLKL